MPGKCGDKTGDTHYYILTGEAKAGELTKKPRKAIALRGFLPPD